jgi:hypothetical protein
MTGKKRGERAIKKLIFSLAAICAIALGVVWMVLDPAPPAKSTAEERAATPLAYQQAISQKREAKPTEENDAGKTADIPPFETVTSETPPAAPPGDGADPSAVQALPSDEDIDGPQDMASLPDEDDGMAEWPGGDPSQTAAVPGEPPAPYDGVPPMPGEPGANQWGTDGAEQWGDERAPPWAYGPRPQGAPHGPAAQGDPYGPPGQGDPYGPPQAEQWGGQESTEWADESTEEWVEVIISGASMRATAAEDAPMLFAFPYGRSLKVVSRYEGWVEVTDPQSSATGWMQAHMVGPASANRRGYGQGQAYYDDEAPRGRRGGWFKRNSGGLSDMINRALGGN